MKAGAWFGYGYERKCKVNSNSKVFIMSNWKSGIISWDRGRTQGWFWRLKMCSVLEMWSLNSFQIPKWLCGGSSSESSLSCSQELGSYQHRRGQWRLGDGKIRQGMGIEGRSLRIEPRSLNNQDLQPIKDMKKEQRSRKSRDSSVLEAK